MEVTLHVYDLSMGMARQMSGMLLGVTIDLIPHTGIVISGLEYFYGGGPQVLPTAQVPMMFGLSPVERVTLGTTSRTKDEIRAWLRSVSGQYTQASYDLFTNNCNHFSAALAAFLGVSPVPSRITDIPSRVLATPMGGMIGEMMRGMQGRMAASGAASDPFTALAAGGADSVAAATRGTLGSGGLGAPAPAPAPAPAAARLPPPSSLLPSSSGPLLSSEPGNVSSLVARLLKVEEHLPRDSPHRLSLGERHVMQALPAWAASPLVGAEEGAGGAGAAEWRSAASVVTRIYRTWPRTASAFPALCLARLLALRQPAVEVMSTASPVRVAAGGSGAAHMVPRVPLAGCTTAAVVEQTGDPEASLSLSGSCQSDASGGSALDAPPLEVGLLWDLAESAAAALDPADAGAGAGDVGKPTASPGATAAVTSAFGTAPAAVMALTTLTNAFATQTGREWGVCHAQPLLTVALGLLNAPEQAATSAQEAGTAVATTATQLRALAAALAVNLCQCLPVGSDTAGLPHGSTQAEPGGAPVAVSDTSVQLLCALLEPLAGTDGAAAALSGVAEVVRRRLLGAGRLLLREGAPAGELALTLGLDEGPRAVQATGGLPEPVRALAGEVLQVLARARDAADPFAA